jgi:hypothetical protein
VLVRAEPTPRRDRTAIAASIALHLCALALLAAIVPRLSISAEDPDERTLLTTILQIERRPPPHESLVHRPVAQTAPVPVAALPVIHAAVTVEHAARRLVVAAEHRAAFAPAPAAVRRPPPSAAQPLARVAVALPTAAPVAEAAATTAPAASPAPSPVAAQREEGIGNFGETYPASVEPSLRGTLLAGVAGFVVRVTVDENGRATSIEFVRPPSDPAQRDELRARLLAAHFIPAACNGLRCAGTLELRN